MAGRSVARRGVAVGGALALTLVGTAAEAGATVPGRPGRIAFVTNLGRELGIALTTTRHGSTVIDSGANTISPAWSPDGTRLAFASDRGGVFRIFVVRADGSGARALDPQHRRGDGFPAWSPNGRLIAFATTRWGSSDLALMTAAGTHVRRLTKGAVDATEPSWSPDGTRIVFASRRAGTFDLWRIDVTARRVARITTGPAVDTSPDWSPDGRWIVFNRSRAAVHRLAVVPASGGKVRLLGSGRHDLAPAWSPDGRRIVFARAFGNRSSLAVMTLATRAVRLVPTGRNVVLEPAWQPLRR